LEVESEPAIEAGIGRGGGCHEEEKRREEKLNLNGGLGEKGESAWIVSGGSSGWGRSPVLLVYSIHGSVLRNDIFPIYISINIYILNLIFQNRNHHTSNFEDRHVCPKRIPLEQPLEQDRNRKHLLQ
jgi:hypothetical protein